MEIRKFEVEDINKLVDLSIESIDYCSVNDYSPEHIKFWKTIIIPVIFKQIQQNADNFLGFVSIIKSEIAGACFFDLTNKKIKGLYVKPKFLGQKIGKNLIIKIENAAHERGFQEIYLDSSINAVKFYESLGYCKIQTGICEDIEPPSIKMRKIFK